MKKILFFLLSVLPLLVAAQTNDTLIVKNGDREIFGILHRPAASPGEKLPVAIIAHGFNATYIYGLKYFDRLDSIGYQCYALDFPCGALGSRIDNNTVNMSILDEESDLMAVIDYFASRDDVDKDNIVLIGESQGGLVSALVGSKIPGKVSHMVLTYPAFVIPEHHNKRFPDIDAIPDTVMFGPVPLGKRFFAELHGMDAYREMPKYKRPVLLVQGDKDPVVRIEDTERALKIYPDARLRIVKGGGHGFDGPLFEEYMDYITDFLTGK